MEGLPTLFMLSLVTLTGGALLGLTACADDTTAGPVTCDAPPAPGATMFEDRTAAVGVTFTHHMQTPLCHITDTIGGPGVCAFDYDADGDVDLFLPDRKGHASALYRNDGATFSDVAASSGVDAPGDAVGCLAFDYDGDDDLDLLVTAIGEDKLYQNQGNGRFDDVTGAAGLSGEDGFSTSATAGDIDGDGDLDLFIARLVVLSTCPDACNLFPINCQAETSLLYVNDGGVFKEESAARGVDAAEPSLAALFFDQDEDGDLDLYVGNDMGIAYEDRLYVNDGSGRFVDHAEQLGYSAAGTDTMGADVGDLDGDGALDMVTTDFRDRPTRYYHCNNDDLPCSFESLPPESTAWVNWGVGMVDVDADGDLDVFQTSGDVYDPELEGSPNQLFLNDGTGRLHFYEPAAADGLTRLGIHRGAAFADLDGDRDLDVVVGTNGGPPRLLYNVGAAGHSIAVELGPRDVGARVTVKAGDRSLTEHLLVGGSFLSSSDPRMHFGIGEACEAEVVVQRLQGPPVSGRVLAGETIRL